MSRFWAGGSSSDSDSSDDDSSSGSSHSSGPKTGGGQNQWVALSDSSSSDSEVRVVKSGKDRAMETFQQHIKTIKAAMKERDYYKIQTEFDNLAKAMIKAKQYLADGVPKVLVKILVQLEDYISERLQDKDQFSSLSARQSRALNRMKLTLKKHNKAYMVVMQAYRDNPDDESESEASAESSSDSDDEGSSSSSSDSSGSSGDDESSDESDSEKSSGSDSDDWGSSSSSSEEEEEEATKGLTGRARWLKKNTAVKEKVVKNKDERAKQRKAAAEKARAVAEAAVTATKSLIPEESLTISLLNKKVKEIASMRGRKGKDNRVILRELEALYRLSQQFGPRTEVPILMNVISAQFGLLRTMDDYMDTLTWKACASHLSRIADVIDQGYTLTPEIIDETDYLTGATKMKAAAMGKGSGGAVDLVAKDEKLVNPHTGEDETQDERDERLRLEQERSMTEEEKKKIPVVGSLSLHLNRLEEEYTKSLQQTSHHSPDYVARLRDESKLVELLTRYQAYFEKQGDVRDAVLLAQLRIEHIYYRHDTIAKQVDRSARFYEMFGDATILHPACVTSDEVGKGQSDFTQFHPAAFAGKPSIEDTEDVDFASLMAELSSFVYKQGTGMAKMRATVCQIYHHALHDRFNEARDLLLMSHLQDTIQNCGDISTMILFNRMMVTVGMCAFRVGRIYDAHQALSDICSGRVRELLAQGFQASRYSDKTLEQEKAEKRRQVPYHMHINLDLLEACHLISAMLLEIPIMAAASVDGDWSARRSRYVSRTFRKYFDQYNHQVFNGPPEQTRDFVMRASMCLKNGDWKACAGFLTGLDVWQLVPGIDAQTQIAAMLKEKIKVEGLRTYMFAFSARYDSMSLEQLCTMFEMAKSEAKNIVSKMMIAREIHASWDQPTETIVFRRVKSSPLQLATLLFAEKAVNLAESNERLLDAQTGGYGFREDWKEDDRFQSRGHHGNRNKHGRRNVPGNKQRGRRY